jgi:hypothetical protein
VPSIEAYWHPQRSQLGRFVPVRSRNRLTALERPRLGGKGTLVRHVGATGKGCASLPTKSRSNNVKAQDANYANDAADRRKHQRRSGLAVVRSEHPTPERDCRDKPEKSAAPHCVRSLTLFGSSANRDNHVRYWGVFGQSAVTSGDGYKALRHLIATHQPGPTTSPLRACPNLAAAAQIGGWFP